MPWLALAGSIWLPKAPWLALAGSIWASNAQAGSIWLPTLALGALQRLAGSIWPLTNAPTTAPSKRLAKKIDVQQGVLPRRCLLRSLCNVSFMLQI